MRIFEPAFWFSIYTYVPEKYMDKNEDITSKYFRLSSFYTSSFLYAKGLQLVNIDKITDSKRAYFVFLDSPERELWLERFNFGNENDPEMMIDARKLITSIKTLKEKLY